MILRWRVDRLDAIVMTDAVFLFLFATPADLAIGEGTSAVGALSHSRLGYVVPPLPTPKKEVRGMDMLQGHNIWWPKYLDVVESVPRECPDQSPGQSL